jgi:hypothetical protein
MVGDLFADRGGFADAFEASVYPTLNHTKTAFYIPGCKFGNDEGSRIFLMEME